MGDKILHQLCGKVSSLFSNSGPGNEFSQLLHYLESPLLGILPTLETFATLISALHSLKCTLPCALVIAPGFLRGALRAKSLLPMASEPGMLALVAPWFFVASMWSIYAVLFRFIRSLFLILGLTVLAFGPMTIYAVGDTHGLSRPIDDKSFVLSYRRMQKVAGIVYLIALVLTIIGLIETIPPLIGNPPESIKPAIRGIICPQQFVSAFFGGMFMFCMSSIAASDWIIVEVAVQRRVWLEHVGLYEPHHDDEYHVHELFKDSEDDRLDAFAYTFRARSQDLYRLSSEQSPA